MVLCATALTLGAGTAGAAPTPNESNALFTVEMSAPIGSRTLVSPGRTWRYFKGTRAPEKGWEKFDDDSLVQDSGWKSATGDFGYGYGNIGTALNDMSGNYSTFYIRQTFTVDEVIDPARLKLQIDYDDAFVAFLDGQEIARSNVSGPEGEWPAHNSLAASAHPAAGAETFPLGPPVSAVFSREEDGPKIRHVLAIQGINRSLSDGGFRLSATLKVDDLFPITTTGTIQLSGRAALPGVASVTVNGTAAAYDSAGLAWSKSQALQPGLNRLTVQAFDANNRLIASETRHVLFKPSTVPKTGSVDRNTTWGPEQGIIEVNNRLQIASGATLTIGAGTTVLFGPSGGLRTRGGTINIAGTSDRPVFLAPSDGRTPWRELAANDRGSQITMRFAEMIGAGIHVTNFVQLLVEDSIVRDFSYDPEGFERYLIYTVDDCTVNLRRSQFRTYYSIALGWQTVLQIEDSVFGSCEHDFIKPQRTVGGSAVRRSTFENSNVSGADALDTGAEAKLIIDGCIFRNIPDKAISVESSELTVKNCLIYDVGTGIAVKDGSEVKVLNNTIANSKYGLAVYIKLAGADFETTAWGTNNIIWGNRVNVTLENPDTGVTSSRVNFINGYNDIEGRTVYPGRNNLNSDPLFASVAARDYRLRPGSPAIGSGLGGVNMGALPVLGPTTGPLTILQQPAGQTVAMGAVFTLSVGASDTAVSYQWKRNGVALAGATNASLVLANFDSLSEGSYQVEVSDGTTTLTSDPAVVLLNAPARFSLSQLPAGQLELRLIGAAASSFLLESSTDLVSWTQLLTSPAPNGIAEFRDSPTNAQLFYRFRTAP